MEKQILDFIKSRPLLSLRRLEKDLSLPDATIRKAVAGLRQLPKKHLITIQEALKQYGFLEQKN